MANNFVRGPQGVTNNNDEGDEEGRPFGGPQQFSAYLSSIYEQAQAATGSVNVVTQTTMQDDSTMTASPDDGTIDISDVETSDGLDSFTAEPSSSSYSSYPGTTLATQTSSQLQQTSSPQNTDTPLLHAAQSDGNDDGGLSKGQLAAAIAVPIIFTALLSLLAFLIFRRRRRSSQNQTRPDTSNSNSSRSAGLFGLREKWGSLKSSASSQHNEKSPEVSSAHNNAYMTGLDTSSRDTTSSPHDEPPPYPANDAPVLARNMTNFSHPRPSQDLHAAPPAPAVSDDFRTPNPSFLRSARPGSTRSINSDAYSDTASIHSARAARMSVGTVILPGMYAAHGANKSGSEGDPFETPTPSLMLGRGRSRQDSGESKDSGKSKESLDGR
ncbi:hypothetical protein Slin14017_G123340 [Septoria linicola]|nr:hypothetical protein Slin14017_G123340 [Septoria linicola]